MDIKFTDLGNNTFSMTAISLDAKSVFDDEPDLVSYDIIVTYNVVTYYRLFCWAISHGLSIDSDVSLIVPSKKEIELYEIAMQ